MSTNQVQSTIIFQYFLFANIPVEIYVLCAHFQSLEENSMWTVVDHNL